jgi:drug/metabolite transporter (DMT)-like permease
MSVIWGIPYLLIRVAVRELSPAELVFLRTGPAALLLMPLALRRGNLRGVAEHWRAIVLYSAVELALPWFMLFRAEKRLSSSVAGLLVATVPLIGAVLARLTGSHEHFGRRRLAGLALGFAGVAVLVGVDLRGTDLLAVGEIGLTALGYATGPIIVARMFSDLPSIGVVTASLVFTAVGYAPFALARPLPPLSGEVIASVTVLMVVCTALAFILFFALIAEAGPARAVVITYVNPAVAVLLGVTALGEPFNAGVAAGFPMILVGSVLATSSSKRVAGSPDSPEASGASAQSSMRAQATGGR